MSSRKNLTIRERVRALEVEVKNLGNDVKSSTEEIRELGNHVSDVQKTLVKFNGKFDSFEKRLDAFEAYLNNMPSGLTRRDKVAIALALISSITSIVIVLIQTLA